MRRNTLLLMLASTALIGVVIFVAAQAPVDDDEWTNKSSRATTQSGPTETELYDSKRDAAFTNVLEIVPKLVPADTKDVELLTTWNMGPAADFEEISVWIVTPANPEFIKVGNLLQASPLRIPVSNEMADREGQSFSAWRVELRADGGQELFVGSIRIQMTAYGNGQFAQFSPASQPLAPGETLVALQAEGFLADSSAGHIRPLTGEVHNFDRNGIVVAGASRVVVTVEIDNPITNLDLLYHGADKRTMQSVMPTGRDGNVLIFIIEPREEQFDSRYLQTGQWQFQVEVGHDVRSEDRDIGGYAGDYKLTVVVHG